MIKINISIRIGIAMLVLFVNCGGRLDDMDVEGATLGDKTTVDDEITALAGHFF